MAKKKAKEPRKQIDDLIRECELSFADWQSIHESGCRDPCWADGVNLNLVRNHIIYYKREICRLCDEYEFDVPEVVAKELPPEVESNYMARAEEIRTNAKVRLQAFLEFDDYKKLNEKAKHFSPEQRNKLCITAVLGYVRNLERAMTEDDLVCMRRYEQGEYYFEAITKKLEEIKDEKSESYQITLFDMA